MKMWSVLRFSTAVLFLYCGWALTRAIDGGNNVGFNVGAGLVAVGLAAVVVWPDRGPAGPRSRPMTGPRAGEPGAVN
jgi:hypothetical protein